MRRKGSTSEEAFWWSFSKVSIGDLGGRARYIDFGKRIAASVFKPELASVVADKVRQAKIMGFRMRG